MRIICNNLPLTKNFNLSINHRFKINISLRTPDSGSSQKKKKKKMAEKYQGRPPFETIHKLLDDLENLHNLCVTWVHAIEDVEDHYGKKKYASRCEP
jgi:hypothetical protein